MDYSEALRALRTRKRLLDFAAIATLFVPIALGVFFTKELLSGSGSARDLLGYVPSPGVGIFALAVTAFYFLAIQMLGLRCPRCQALFFLKYAPQRSFPESRARRTGAFGTIPGYCAHCGLGLNANSKPENYSRRSESMTSSEQKSVEALEGVVKKINSFNWSAFRNGTSVGLFVLALVYFGRGYLGDGANAFWLAYGFALGGLIFKLKGWETFQAPEANALKCMSCPTHQVYGRFCEQCGSARS